MYISKKFLSKEKLDCSLLCAEPFASFRRHEKKRKERLEEEYKSKVQRLKATEQYKGGGPRPYGKIYDKNIKVKDCGTILGQWTLQFNPPPLR